MTRKGNLVDREGGASDIKSNPRLSEKEFNASSLVTETNRACDMGNVSV